MNERAAQIFSLWNSGAPYDRIASEMGLTKGTVAGVLHRLRKAGKPMRKQADPGIVPVPPAPKPAETEATSVLSASSTIVAVAKKKPAPPKVRQAATRPPTPPAHRSWRHECQYIEGDPSPDDTCKCRKPVEPGSPYCAEHKKLCFSGIPEIKARADKDPLRSIPINRFRIHY